MKTLLPGDRVIYLSATGRKMRGTVADYLPMSKNKRLEFIPVMKRNQKHPMFYMRYELRKLP